MHEMRIALIVFTALIVVLTGYTVTEVRARTRTAEDAEKLRIENLELLKQVGNLSGQLDEQEALFERVKRENDDLYTQLQTKDQREVAALATPAALPEDLFAEEEPFELEAPEAAPAREPRRDERGRGRGGIDWNSEEWQARREEFANRARERIADFATRQLERANDPASQQRVLAMEEYSNYMMDLMQEMRAAANDEQREQLREEMRTARESMQTLVTQQQDHLLRQTAQNFGITNASKQEEFVQAMRSTMQDPFFRSPDGGMMGVGRGGFGGGARPGGDGGDGGGWRGRTAGGGGPGQ
jgi:hypothetical protein